ncbi:MAG: DMT family transporter [Clostridium sp.]|uniref:DMT family transporter n=1 Tax=Clostridium sp. TaxID=1506 RepID=UPI00306F8B98
MRNKGYLLIALAGILWSLLGILVNGLVNNNFTPEQVGFTRLFLGFLFLSAYSFFKTPNSLKLNKVTFMYSLIIGIITQALFNLSYFNAINKIGVSLAAILLYTSPIFLAIFSKLIYKEHLNKNKVFSLALCFIGALMSLTGGFLNFSTLSISGLLLGLCSALTYALMPIISKTALKSCDRFSLLIYGFLFGSILMAPFANPLEILPLLHDKNNIILCLCLGLLPGASAYICYVSGINTDIELSKVGIISSIELIISVIIGWVILDEPFSIIKLIGLFTMILSIFIVKDNVNPKQDIK